MFFVQVVRGRPGGRLQLSGGGSKMAWLASAFSSIRARRAKKARRRDLTMDESGGWLVGSATDVGISDKVVHCKHFGVLNVELLSTHSVPVRLGAEERVNTADTACIVCGTGSIRNGRSVRLSVPSIDSSSAVRP